MRLEAVILGIIQGLTEWMPISSTGHLKLAEMLLGLRLPLLFDIMLHAGTLAVTVLFFRGDIKRILKALLELNLHKSEGGIILQRIIVGTISTAAIALPIMRLENIFYDVKLIGFLFLLSGLITYASRVGRGWREHISLWDAALIGAAQGFSILPGLSRSGLTISFALILGIEREKAFKFSFLLSIPAIIGGLIITLIAQYSAISMTEMGFAEALMGTIVAAILGYLSLRALRRILKYFHNIAIYSLTLGLLLIFMGGSICTFLI